MSCIAFCSLSAIFLAFLTLIHKETAQIYLQFYNLLTKCRQRTPAKIRRCHRLILCSVAISIKIIIYTMRSPTTTPQL